MALWGCVNYLILPPKLPNFVPCFSKVYLHCRYVTPGDGYFTFFSQGFLQQCFSLQSTHCFQFIHQLGPRSTTTYSCSGLCYYLWSLSSSFFCHLISCFPGPGSLNQFQWLKIHVIIMCSCHVLKCSVIKKTKMNIYHSICKISLPGHLFLGEWLSHPETVRGTAEW